MKIGDINQSNFSLNPTQTPIPIPIKEEIKTPTTNGLKVSA
jgi:hypothetical protein